MDKKNTNLCVEIMNSKQVKRNFWLRGTSSIFAIFAL